MSNKKPLPIGNDIFENLIKNDCYYIDKTGLIEYLKEKKGVVNLFTRPRRFGKTLNMTMLYEFFRINGNPELFNEVLKLVPDDSPSKVYIDRCNHYKKEPPEENWDGRFVLKTK